jgi:hypothetical protein
VFFRSLQIAAISLALLASSNAHAKFVQFTESYAGYFTEELDPDIGLPKVQYNFFNSEANLTTNHYVFNFDPGSYSGFGTFTRTDSSGAFSGLFDFHSEIPDYYNPGPSDRIQIGGTFNSDQFSEGNTGAYRFGAATGVMKGFIDSNPNYTSFQIDWYVFTPDTISPVPEPSTILLFSSGLLLLASMVRKSANRGLILSKLVTGHS